ncbi:hypothetical protein DM558_07550 [Entomomonas moraniae]|uniref:Antirepressor protein ant N-terminal domain-containing protein n=1 Tax=Entomomonas moraniae TaxID=2213226 RepID=A0A3S9XDW2_9GAMM|nr:phage antirepressor N-terminal domain-containing protein [Entomomonas moraniae]AZS50642.1 hypothetical protein DM558_07550 [Entomomonas moraniae]
MNNITLQATEIQSVSFHNQSIAVLSYQSKPYVAMKPIVENIGLSWTGQFKRIQRHNVLSRGVVMITIPSRSGEQQYTCLPLSMLNGWLLGIDTNRVKPELREKLEQYQLECFDVLFEYWTTGEVKKKTKTTVDQRTPLRDAVNLLVSKKAITYSEAYSIVHQRFNVASIEDLLQDQLSQAVEYVHKVALEGEYIPKEISTSRQVTVNKTNLSCLINSMEWIYKYYKEYNLLEVSRMLQSDFGAKLHDHVISGYTSSRSLS